VGVVYKALDTKLDRHVAIKFLPPKLQSDEQAKKPFVHESFVTMWWARQPSG
jgi:serine/threonine protein kinase